MNDNLLEHTNRFIKQMREELNKSRDLLRAGLAEYEDANASRTSKEFLDNASKTSNHSSGYDDEEFNDEDEVVVERHAAAFRKTYMSSGNVSIDEDYNEGEEDVLVISDEEDADDFDVWTICSDDGERLNLRDDQSTSDSKKTAKHFRILTHLPFYPPSEHMKISQNENFSFKSLRDSNDIINDYISNSRLNKDNINLVFQTLLEIEDITVLSEYPGLAQKDVILNWTAGREYWIPISSDLNVDDIMTPFMDELVLIPKGSSALAEASPPKYVIDSLFCHPHEHVFDMAIRRRVATICKVSKDQVHFYFSKEEGLSAAQISSLSCTKYDIIFRPRRLPVRYQLRALEMLGDSESVRQYLFPQMNPLRDLKYEPQLDFSLFNTTIASNPEQLEAVRFITEGPSPHAPFVIFGPPGTGKTTTIAESILQLRLLKPGSRILVTAGSNAACDTIALRICKYFNSNPRLQEIEQRDPENQKSIIRIYSKTIIEKGLHLIDPELQANSNCKDGIHYYPSVETIRQYGIIVATLCTVGKLVTGDIGEKNFFSHLFIDEAAASTEPEALVGIMGIKSLNCRVILSGDHKQLGPIIKSDRATQLGLEKSLMERLLSCPCYDIDENSNYDRTIQARLKRNYRSHPKIVGIFNHLYYKNELIAEAKMEDVNMGAKWCKLPNPNFPIIFQAVHGKTEKDTISPSSRNNLELQVLMWFLQRLLVDGIDGHPVAQSDIGIITPYRLQNKLIHSRLQGRGWTEVESGSVEAFQGREKQIIIVSLVRSFAGLGFVRNPKRLNVILSRPKSLLILMGNPLTLKRHQDFAYIMDQCRSNGTFLRKKRSRNRKTKVALTLKQA